jgi:hypothetical protein
MGAPPLTDYDRPSDDALRLTTPPAPKMCRTPDVTATAEKWSRD